MWALAHSENFSVLCICNLNPTCWCDTVQVVLQMCIAGVISQSLQLGAHVTLVSLGCCYKSGECAKSCAC